MSSLGALQFKHRSSVHRKGNKLSESDPLTSPTTQEQEHPARPEQPAGTAAPHSNKQTGSSDQNTKKAQSSRAAETNKSSPH